jgi:hypothetical protein
MPETVHVSKSHRHLLCSGGAGCSGPVFFILLQAWFCGLFVLVSCRGFIAGSPVINNAVVWQQLTTRGVGQLTTRGVGCGVFIFNLFVIPFFFLMNSKASAFILKKKDFVRGIMNRKGCA